MRALLREDRADDELAHALARAGLYVERVGRREEVVARLARGDVAVVDPRLLEERPAPSRGPDRRAISGPSLEALCYDKLCQLLDGLGAQRLPDLHQTVLAQMERALLRLALERTGSVAAAAEFLGIHRNTLARRLEALGLRERKTRQARAPTRRTERRR